MENRTEELKETIGRIINDAMYCILDEDDSRYLAEELIDKGYRKSSDVAREIFDYIEALIEPNGDYLFRWDLDRLAELKNKYTEGEG